MLANVVRSATGRQLNRLVRRPLLQKRLLTSRSILAQRGNSTYLRSLAVARQSFQRSFFKRASESPSKVMRLQSLAKRHKNLGAGLGNLSTNINTGDDGVSASINTPAGKMEINIGEDGKPGPKPPKPSSGGFPWGTILLLGILGIGGYFAWKKWVEYQAEKSSGMPEIRSKKSLCAKYLTHVMYKKLKNHKTRTTGFTLDQVIANAVAFDNQNVGVYAGDYDCYYDYGELFDPIIKDYHKFSGKHKSDLNVNHIKGNIDKSVPVKSTRIRVGRNIRGYGLMAGISRKDRKEIESLMRNVFAGLEGDLAGTYYPLQGMNEYTRKQLVDDHFLFISGDPNLIEGGIERDWPEARGIFHNKDKTFLVWVNEEDQLRIISMQKGGNVKQVFERLARGIEAIEKGLKKQGKSFQFDDRLGYIHSCPTNLGTGMRASVHIDLPELTRQLGGHDGIKEHCKEMHLQARGTRGESSGETGTVYDISNLHRLGYTEVELVQTMIDGVNKLWQQNKNAYK